MDVYVANLKNFVKSHVILAPCASEARLGTAAFAPTTLPDCGHSVHPGDNPARPLFLCRHSQRSKFIWNKTPILYQTHKKLF